MKILVCISKTPDTTAKISFKDGDTQFNDDGVQYIMNPYDEWYALVKALEIKEKAGGTVTVAHVGPASNDTIIRKALAIGADNAIRIDKEPSSSRDVATQITSVVVGNGYDLILTGKETINYNGSEMGSMLAGLLTWPFISYATGLDIVGEKAEVSRDIEGGSETLLAPMPLVVSAAKGLAVQRIPNMRGIMMAKSKPLEVVSPEANAEHLVITQYELPTQRTACKMVDPEQMDALVKLLHEEAKVI